MRLAIVIPFFKLTFFRQTLGSLAAQSDQRFTVFIGNDASPENPEELLKEFESKFTFVYKRFDQNVGGTSLTNQWERCIEMIQGEEWLMVLGDDDTLSDKVVEKFYENLPAFNKTSNVVRFSSQVIDEKGYPVARIYRQPQYEDPIHSYYRKFRGENRGSLSEFIFRRSQYDKFKFKNYPLGWTADDRAVIDICEGRKIFSINEAKVYFRKSTLHISSREDNFELKHQAHLQSMKDLIRDYHDQMDDEKRIFFIRLYENHILTFKKVNVEDWLYLHYLYFRFMKRHDILILLKSVIAKFLK